MPIFTWKNSAPRVFVLLHNPRRNASNTLLIAQDVAGTNITAVKQSMSVEKLKV
jgi:hypothetical protein